jgi:hypothetical protein
MESKIMAKQNKVKMEDLNDDDCLIKLIDNGSVDKLACVIKRGKPGAGCLSQELVNKMMLMLLRSGHKLTALYFSSDGAEDIMEWESSYTEEIEQKIYENINTTNITVYKRYHLPEDKVYAFSSKDGIVDCICEGIIDRS